MFDHNTLTVMIALRFALDAPNLLTAVLCLTSNTSEYLRSYFLALGFLVGSYWLGFVGLLSLHTSVVDTVYSSIISLYFCSSSH